MKLLGAVLFGISVGALFYFGYTATAVGSIAFMVAIVIGIVSDIYDRLEVTK